MKPTIDARVLFFSLFLLITNSISAQTAAIEKLQRELPKSKDSIVYINKLNRIAILMYMKNPDSCFFYAARAKRMAIRQKYKKGENDANNVLGTALSLKGLHHDALKMYSKALAYYKESGDIGSEARIYMSIAATHRHLSDSVSCIRALKKGITLAKKKPNDSIMAAVYSTYCDLAPDLSVDSSRYYMQKAIKIATQYKDSSVLMINKLLEVTLLLDSSRKTEALPILQSVLIDAKSTGLEYIEISVYDLLAKYYADQPEKAVTYYEEVLNILNTKGYINLKPVVIQRMLPYVKLTGDKEKQFKLTEELADAVGEKQQRLSAFFSDYVHYNELDEANKLLEINAAEDRKRSWILGFFSAICLLMLSIIYIQFRKTRKKTCQTLKLNSIIEQKNQALQTNDEFKNKLISILAHDFRSPLISTLSLIEILKSDQELSQKEMEKFYAQIQSDINNMLARFDSTLQWIRQQLLGYSVNTSSLYARPLIDEATQVFLSEMQRKGIAVRNDIPTNLKIQTDKEMLQFINRNLISNAIKFSPKNGVVTVSAEITKDKIIIGVADQGNGLDAKTTEGLFSITAKGSTLNGAGIALSMCRDFIEKLGGSIRAENGNDGAVFYYELPA